MARLAGDTAAAVIVEILNEDGTMARRPQLEEFAKNHDLKIGTIADLIEYRSNNEKTVEKISQCNWPTEHGEFELSTFKDTIDGELHFALTMGEITPEKSNLVRVHRINTFTDLLQGQRSSIRSWSLTEAMSRIATEKQGVLLLLSGKETAETLSETLQQFNDADNGRESIKKNPNQGARTVGIGSQILHQLGVGKMRLMSQEKHYYALSGFNLEVVEYIQTEEPK